MKTTVEPISAVEKQIRVEVPADEVARRMEKGYAEVRKMVPIRGFRKGKAPLSMVKRLFKESVEADVAEDLVKESLSEAVRQSDLKVVSRPRVEGAKLTEGAEFAFTATVEVVPDVDPVDYKGLPAVREKTVTTDEQVETALGHLRESFAHYHVVEGRGAAAPDLVEIAFSSSAAGTPIETGQPATLILGTGVPLGAEFEEKLAGVSPGDARSFEIAFPKEFPNPKYAGKTAAFDVTVGSVREKVLPAFDEEFAKNFKDVAGLADLKAKMRERLGKEAEDRSRLRMEEDLRTGLLAKNTVEVPKALVDRQIVSMMRDTANRLASQGVDLKKVSMDFDKMRERFTPAAERAVRVSLLLEGIARKENIEVSFQDLDAEMKGIAAASGMDYEKVRQIYGDEERLDELRDRLLERKVMDFLLSNAQVTEEGAAE